MISNTTLNKLIEEYRGSQELIKFLEYKLGDVNILRTACSQCLIPIPIKFGQCAQLSSFLAGFLKDEYDIPAIVVAGDLKINNITVFDCKENLPSFQQKQQTVQSMVWDGHCWVEIDGYIVDLSIFRTAYEISSPSILRTYIESKFGKDKGAFACPKSHLPQEMKYIPKYVLTDFQIDGLIASLGYELENNI